MSTRKSNRPSGEKQRNKNQKEERNRKDKQSRGLLKKVGNILFYTITLGFLVMMVLFGITQKNDTSLVGYRFFNVRTGSMVSPGNTLQSGGFRAGDIIVTRETPEKQLNIGDIVTFRPSTNPTNAGSNYLTHRIVKTLDELGGEKGTFLITKGDANDTDDMPFNANQVVGKVLFRIPKIGGILVFIQKNTLISAVFTFALYGFVVVMRIYILADTKQKRTTKQTKDRENARAVSTVNKKTAKKKTRDSTSKTGRKSNARRVRPKMTHGIASASEVNIKNTQRARRKHT